jgi:predicted flap endonuclease-1-like 5' DNA nuclease
LLTKVAYKGIGPVYAKKLVEKFGEKIFDIIEHESGRLQDVEGIGPKRRLRIKEACIHGWSIGTEIGMSLTETALQWLQGKRESQV